jgi:excisionase family DNA binding protein
MKDQYDPVRFTLEEIRLLNAVEVSKILNCSRAFAYRLMRSGDLRTIRIGRTVRVRLPDLELYINSLVSG